MPRQREIYDPLLERKKEEEKKKKKKLAEKKKKERAKRNLLKAQEAAAEAEAEEKSEQEGSGDDEDETNFQGDPQAEEQAVEEHLESLHQQSDQIQKKTLEESETRHEDKVLVIDAPKPLSRESQKKTVVQLSTNVPNKRTANFVTQNTRPGPSMY